MRAEAVRQWAAIQSLSASDVDCATAVMLKILDGKCKMGSAEKQVMAWLYDALKNRPSLRFDEEYHALIALGRVRADEGMNALLYERRVLAETAISRPVMKAFKAMLRARGLFAGIQENADEE